MNTHNSCAFAVTYLQGLKELALDQLLVWSVGSYIFHETKLPSVRPGIFTPWPSLPRIITVTEAQRSFPLGTHVNHTATLPC